MPRRPRPDTVPIPDAHDPHEPAIRFLLESPDHLSVGDKTRLRALRLIQALADEARRRGYTLLPPESAATFRIDIGQDSFSFILSEEQDSALCPPQEQVATTRYSWQRVEPQPAQIPSGRLALELLQQRRRARWADRNRWRLQNKFAAVLALIEQQASDAAAQRGATAAEHTRQVALWEQAVPRARERYLRDLNTQRLKAQVAASEEAQRIRAYCRRLADRAVDEHDPATRHAIDDWVVWARAQADEMDPLGQVAELREVQLAESTPEDSDRYMPKGMTVRHPPGAALSS